MTNGALVYHNQSGRHREEGCMAMGRNNSVVKDHPGEPGRTQLHVGLPSAWGFVDGSRIFSPLLHGTSP